MVRDVGKEMRLRMAATFDSALAVRPVKSVTPVVAVKPVKSVPPRFSLLGKFVGAGASVATVRSAMRSGSRFPIRCVDHDEEVL